MIFLDRQQKKEWLRKYRHSLLIEQARLYDVEKLRSEAEKITQCITGMPGGGCGADKIPRAVERIDEARRRALDQAEECQRIRSEIEQCIANLQDGLLESVLTLRYIDCRSWTSIEMFMHMSKTTAYRLHAEALDKLIVPEK